MAYSDPYLGETTELSASWSVSDGSVFTISSVTVTIYPIENKTAVIRSAVAGSVDSHRVYYVETFSSPTYVADTQYVCVFAATIVCNGITYVKKHVDTFRVKEA